MSLADCLVYWFVISLFICSAKEWIVESWRKYKDKKKEESKLKAQKEVKHKQLANELSEHIYENLPYETVDDMVKVIYEYFNKKDGE